MKKTQKKEQETTEKRPEDYETKYKSDYLSDWSLHRDYIKNFDPLEAMLIGDVYDSVSNSLMSGSRITDSYTATLAIERASRVMGKLPEGYTESTFKADEGKAAFMDIIRQKWVYPNANAQHDFEIKLRLWDLYSFVYGYMLMFYDWNVSPSGYVGPDCWLWSPRNFIPQQGRTSIDDMDYATALTYVSKKYLKDVLDEINGGSDDGEDSDEGGWNKEAVEFLIELAENEETDSDEDKDTFIERKRTSSSVKKGICLATRYEAGEGGRWITFAPDYHCIEVRNLENPHKNGRIPFVIKYCQPLFDSFYGLGDFQRAKPLQFARDGLTNFYFKGIKMNLVPPIVANANGVIKKTLDYREGGVMYEIMPNSIRRLETSPAGLSTYQGAQSNLTGSLLSLFGTQNASMPGAETLNPSQGKTPAAINMYSDKEATRDGQDRAYLEAAIEKLTDGFNSLIVNIGTEEIPVSLFADDIEEIRQAGLSDVMDMFSKTPNSTGTAYEMKIDPKKLSGVEYRFNINPGSTAKINKAETRESLKQLMDSIGKFQNIFKEDQRVEIDWPLVMSMFEKSLDMKGVGKIVKINNGPSPREAALMEQLQMAQEQIAQLTQAQQQPEAQPITTKSGRTFNDQTVANAVSALEAETPSTPQDETVINKAGAFSDSVVGSAAEQILNA